MTSVHDVLVDPPRHIGGNGKSDPLGATAPAEDEVIDADDLAMNINEGAAGVAGIDGRAGLEKFIGSLAGGAAPLGADDPLGHRFLKSERIAHGKDHLTHLDQLRVTESNWLEPLGCDLQDGNIGTLISTRDRSRKGAAVAQLNGDL